MVLALHHVQLTVPPDRLQAARSFYVEQIGFEQVDEPFGIEGFWLAAGGQQLHVRVEAGVDRSKTRAHAAFVVDDLAEILKRLHDDGAIIDPQAAFEGYERVHVIDPGGNRVELMQSPPKGVTP